MKVVYTGLESSGKTLLLAKKAKELLARNVRWFKKYGFKRVLYTNIKFSDALIQKYPGYISYFNQYKDLITLAGVDILWDEISSDFSALKKEPLPRSINRWLRQGAKRGVHIYATAQEFHDIHLDFRRRVFSAYTVKKVIGSGRGGDNLPPIKTIWGLCVVRQLQINPYNELQPEYIGLIGGISSVFLIDRSDCLVFDTHQFLAESEEIPLEHTERKCLKCNKTFVYHR